MRKSSQTKRRTLVREMINVMRYEEVKSTCVSFLSFDCSLTVSKYSTQTWPQQQYFKLIMRNLHLSLLFFSLSLRSLYLFNCCLLNVSQTKSMAHSPYSPWNSCLLII